MIKMKVCMLGAFAVGKTSLVQQYVNSIFSEKYQTTLGVKIDKKSVSINDQTLELILWDLAGEDEFIEVRSSYLRGSSGVILVADGTRAETLDIALMLKQKVDREVGEIPFILLVNKADLADNWTIDQTRLEQLKQDGWFIMLTSAKDSANVEDAYLALATKLQQTL
ncbi:MAG: GTP-binding protein [Gammaproteobacteria bacterium]|nr:GTP-binding protein [Gammaproteobacteria bacterium]MBL7000130.1 GTP-binding protein [Gammaproteobacteria bacterium]